MNFYSVGVTQVELKRVNSIFRVAYSVTFDPEERKERREETESPKTQISTASAVDCLWKRSVLMKQD